MSWFVTSFLKYLWYLSSILFSRMSSIMSFVSFNGSRHTLVSFKFPVMIAKWFAKAVFKCVYVLLLIPFSFKLFWVSSSSPASGSENSPKKLTLEIVSVSVSLIASIWSSSCIWNIVRLSMQSFLDVLFQIKHLGRHEYFCNGNFLYTLNHSNIRRATSSLCRGVDCWCRKPNLWLN